MTRIQPSAGSLINSAFAFGRSAVNPFSGPKGELQSFTPQSDEIDECPPDVWNRVQRRIFFRPIDKLEEKERDERLMSLTT